MRGLNSLLNRYPMPPALLGQLCDRPQLTTTRIRDYLCAYQAHPERLQASPPTPVSGDKALTPYAALTTSTEGEHDACH